MAEYPGAIPFTTSVMRAEIPGRVAAAYALASRGVKLLVDDPAALAAPLVGIATDDHQEPAETSVEYLGEAGYSSTPGLDFYDKFHIVPREIELGNVLSPTQVTLEVFSAFRSRSLSWTLFDNNAGDGVSLVSPPPLPRLFAPMEGIEVDVLIDLVGPALVDATLDFTFNITGTIQVPITLQRVVLFAPPPEQPYEETLEWLTDVIQHADGTEQRRALRKSPRQKFSWDILVEDGAERSRLETALFDWQPRTFGIPMWHEATPLTAAVVGGSTTVLTVASTADADFRDGSLVVVWASDSRFDVLDLVSHTATTITVANPPVLSYTPVADLVLVAPLRLAAIDGPIRGQRYLQGQDRFSAHFRVKDNDAALADASTWSTFNGKILLDDPNFVRGTMPEEYRHPVRRADGSVGLTRETTRQDRHRRASERGFVASGKAGMWRIRKLLWALDGRRVSLYIPTFSKDLVPSGTMTSGQTTLAVQHVGYTAFARSRQPKNVIRVQPVSGAAFIRTITGSTAPTSTQENITVTPSWPTTLTPAQIDRISFVEKVRSDSDTVRITHGPGNARRAVLPLVTVLE